MIKLDIEKYQEDHYDEEKNKFYCQDYGWYFSISGEIYDELIKWY